MSRIRVMHFRREVPTGGGPETLILGIARCIDRTRFELSIAGLSTHSPPDSAMSAGLAELDTPVVRLPVRGRLDYGVVRELARMLDERQIDVLHTHDHRTNLIAALAVRRRPTKLVATLHQPLRRHWWLWHLEMLDELVVQRFDRVLPVAGMIRDELVAKHPRMAARTTAVLNGVDLSRFEAPQDRAAARAELGITPDQVLCLTIGRLSDDKGIDALLDSVPAVARQCSTVRWAIAGRGPLEASLKAQCTRLGLDDRVQFLGYREDVPRLFAAADILVVASTSEGCPIAILEAMAAGCPVVCTRVGGSPEIVVQGRTGLIVEPRRPDELSDAVLRLAADPALRADMAREGRDLAHSRFTIQRMVSDFEAVYTELAGATQPQACCTH